MKCLGCSAENNDTAKFCRMCGTPLSDPPRDSVSGVREAGSTEPPHVSGATARAMWIGAAVVALVSFGAWFGSRPTAQAPRPMSSSPSSGTVGSKPALPVSPTRAPIAPEAKDPANAPLAARKYVDDALRYSAAGDAAAMEDALKQLGDYAKPDRGDRVRARALNKEALDLLAEKRYAEAAVKLREAVAADPRDQEVKNNLAFALIHTAEFDEAERTLIDTLVIDPKRANAWMNLAMTYAKRSVESKAVEGYVMAHRFSRAPEKALAFLVNTATDDQESEAVRGAARRAAEKITGKDLATLTAELRPSQ